jgi:hypothetical protein
MLSRSRPVSKISVASVMKPSTAETLAVKEHCHKMTMVTAAKMALQKYLVLIFMLCTCGSYDRV